MAFNPYNPEIRLVIAHKNTLRLYYKASCSAVESYYQSVVIVRIIGYTNLWAKCRVFLLK